MNPQFLQLQASSGAGQAALTGRSFAAPPNEDIAPRVPHIHDHELLRRIGHGAYGEVWLARTALGAFRAVKIIHRRDFEDSRPFDREFAGIQKFEPLSRSNEGFIDVLQIGRRPTVRMWWA